MSTEDKKIVSVVLLGPVTDQTKTDAELARISRLLAESEFGIDYSAIVTAKEMKFESIEHMAIVLESVLRKIKAAMPEQQVEQTPTENPLYPHGDSNE